jgi:hypothetical protein
MNEFRQQRRPRPELLQQGTRKVRTAQGTVLDNVQAGQPDGKCNRKIPPKPMVLAPWDGKGEMVR